MNEEQKAFIAECEEEFKDRFTDKDEAFMKIKNAEFQRPPIMDPWYNKPPRNFDWSRQNQGHDQGGRRNQGYKRRYDRNNDHYYNSKRYSSN